MNLYLHITKWNGKIHFTTSIQKDTKSQNMFLHSYVCDPILLSEEEESYGLRMLAQVYEFRMLTNG